MLKRVLALLVVAVLGVGIALAVSAAHSAQTETRPSRVLTPGWRNPEVSQANIDATVCVRGYSSKIRPPVSYTSYLKRAMLRYRKLPGTVSDYELDHFIPLSIGGSPFDTRNLWMEPRAAAEQSDPLEYRLYRAVCAHTLTLAEAQQRIIRFKREHG